MIGNYDPNFHGTHIVRVTLMQWDYVGHIALKIGGNCKGASLLEADFLDCNTQEDIENYAENDCGFVFDEDVGIFTAELKNKNGDMLEVEGDSEEIKDMIVSVEISELIPCEAEAAISAQKGDAHEADPV